MDQTTEPTQLVPSASETSDSEIPPLTKGAVMPVEVEEVDTAQEEELETLVNPDPVLAQVVQAEVWANNPSRQSRRNPSQHD
jgi:hypothetical protein